MSRSKKVKQLSFDDLCGNAAPVIKPGAQAAKIKELTDNSEDPQENNFDHVRLGTIKFSDPNASDHHTAKFTALGSGYIGHFELGSVNQSANSAGWSFTVADSVLDPLQEGETLTQRYKVTISDGHGGKDTTIVTVKICGTNDVPVIEAENCDGGYEGSAIGKGASEGGYEDDENEEDENEEDENEEDDGEEEGCHHNSSHDTTGSVGEDDTPDSNGFLKDDGSFTFTDADLKDQHTLTVTPGPQNPLGGTLIAVITDPSTGDGHGEIHWIYSLSQALAQPLTDYDFVSETFDIAINDGHGGIAHQLITVFVSGSSDDITPS